MRIENENNRIEPTLTEALALSTSIAYTKKEVEKVRVELNELRQQFPQVVLQRLMMRQSHTSMDRW
jgi:hypothetical protein